MLSSLKKLTNCGDCPIRHRAVCARCDDDELSVLNSMKFYSTVKAGETIHWAGDEMPFLASVVSGTVKLTQTMEDGRTQMIGLLLPSDFIGRPGRAVAHYDTTAATDTVLCCFRRKPFEELLRTTPHIAERLLEMTLDELDAARTWMMILGRKTAREKIASFLMIIAQRQASLVQLPPADGWRIELPLTREAMADYLGMTLETVSRQISALKRDGILQLDGRRTLIVPSVDRLAAETGDDTDGGFIS